MLRRLVVLRKLAASSSWVKQWCASVSRCPPCLRSLASLALHASALHRPPSPICLAYPSLSSPLFAHPLPPLPPLPPFTPFQFHFSMIRSRGLKLGARASINDAHLLVKLRGYTEFGTRHRDFNQDYSIGDNYRQRVNVYGLTMKYMIQENIGKRHLPRRLYTLLPLLSGLNCPLNVLERYLLFGLLQ
jgi:hypothetical protein